MNNEENHSNGFAVRKVQLSAMLQTGDFYLGRDYYFFDLDKKRTKIVNPNNYIGLGIKMPARDKRTLLTGLIDDNSLNWETSSHSYRIFVELPAYKKQNTDYQVLKHEKEKPFDDPKILLNRMKKLKDFHLKMRILGAENIDQPNSREGVVNFNYINNDVTKIVFDFFSNLGWFIDLRKGKPYNISFLLDRDDMPKSSPEMPEMIFDPEILFNWIIKKITRKTVSMVSGKNPEGISNRIMIDVGESDILKTKKLLENYGVLIIVHSTTKKSSEIFVLKNKTAEDIYNRFGGKITGCELIKILQNPENEKEVRNKYSYLPKKTRKMKMREQNLFDVLRKTLRNGKIIFFHEQKRGEKNLCLQLKGFGKEKAMIYANYGTSEEKLAYIKQATKLIKEAFPEAIIEVFGEAKTKASIHIPGFRTGPEKERGNSSDKIPLTQKNVEEELRNILNNPLLEEGIRQEILAYFQKEEINKRAKFLLSQLKK